MKTQESSRPQRLLRRPEVIERTGLGRTTLYLLERSGKFPQRRQLTPRVVAWVEAEVDQWVRERETRGCPAPKTRPSCSF